MWDIEGRFHFFNDLSIFFTYIYDVGNKDQLRLKILNEVYNPFSQQALLNMNLKNKKCVLDIACGQGEMSCWMAKQMAPDGVVIGVDVSEEQLTLARRLAKEQRIENIKFIKKSVLDPNFNQILLELPCKPNLIYSRWLLIHLQRNKVRNVMRVFYDLLAEGGAMAHEEVTLKESYLPLPAESFKRYVELFTVLANKLNIDFNLGSDLLTLFSELGYSQLKHKIFKPKFSSDQLNFFSLDLDSAIPTLEKYNLINDYNIPILKQSIENDLKKGLDMTMTNYFVYGIK